MTEEEIAALPYRPCVGVVLLDAGGRIFAGERLDAPGAWQMPQGGIDPGEDAHAAGLRELSEETSIPPSAVAVLGQTEGWITYDLPAVLVPKLWKGRFRGQKQRWLLARFTGEDAVIDLGTAHPEFGAWRWMAPEALMAAIVPFKRATYEAVFEAFRGELAGPSEGLSR